MKKSRLILILISIVAFLATGAGITGLIVTFVHPLKLLPPSPFIAKFDSFDQTYVDITWEKVKDASYYTIEYSYALLGNTVKTITVRENWLRIERVKGDLTFRVKALGVYTQQSSEFSPTKVEKIEGIKLDVPMPDYEIIEHIWPNGDITYSLSFEFCEWMGVSYTYKGVEKRIVYYDLVFVRAGMDEEAEKKDLSPLSMTELRSYTHHIDENTRVFLRATNKKGVFGEFDGSVEGDPTELYTLYEPSDWMLITM